MFFFLHTTHSEKFASLLPVNFKASAEAKGEAVAKVAAVAK